MEFPAKPRVIRRFKFKSKSSDAEYLTEVWNDGKITCNCPAYRRCWHEKTVEKYLKICEQKLKKENHLQKNIKEI